MNSAPHAPRRFHLLTLVVLFSLLLVGCGGKSYQLTPVEGTLTIGGKPAANIMIQFMPDVTAGIENGPTSFATSDASGHFELKTHDNKPGAVVGMHIVILVDPEEERPPQGQEATKPVRLSSLYATAKGGFKVEVVPGVPVELKVPAAN